MGKSPSSKKENCPFNQLLGIFGSRYYHNNDAKLHKLFSLIENGINPMEGHIIDEQRCLQIREDLGIGQPLWDALRSALLPGVVLTSRYKLQNYAKHHHQDSRPRRPRGAARWARGGVGGVMVAW